jgi:hypothetical protein
MKAESDEEDCVPPPPDGDPMDTASQPTTPAAPPTPVKTAAPHTAVPSAPQKDMVWKVVIVASQVERERMFCATPNDVSAVGELMAKLTDRQYCLLEMISSTNHLGVLHCALATVRCSFFDRILHLRSAIPLESLTFV